MSGPTQMISVRCTEEEVFRLDGLVGLDGMRNRSDVIRRGVERINEENAPENFGRRMNIRISPGVTQDLKLLANLLEIDASSAVALGVGLLLEQETEKMMSRRKAAFAAIKDVEDQGPHKDHIE